MKKLLLTVFGLCCYLLLQAQPSLEYYLPEAKSYNPSIPKPSDVLGYEVGEWHVEHTLLLNYMRALAAASDRITIEEYGRTYENRPLVLLTITSPANHSRIDQIRENHLKLTNPAQSQQVDIENEPGVIWMGFSVHGNEPSGSNASLLMAYHLAAAQGAEIEEMLSKVVVLFDPSINPDGLNRFASWVNTHKSKNLDADPNSREHNEAWPRGRTNHYWFDLNRDWMPVRHPESYGRMQKYHAWKPNVLTDHHEMGTNSTFFFQPGIPSRNHPLTPQNTYVLTEKIAKYHAAFLDDIGSLYYAKESFDDFYFGKGSTFPDINGAVGILFEQGSSRGHIQESIHGDLTFAFTIKNQLTTALSSFKATYELRKELNTHLRDFYSSAVKEAEKDDLKAYVFNSKDEPSTLELGKMLAFHEIEVYRTKADISASGKRYPAGSLIVPLEQRQYRLIKAMFETRTSFTDSLFYDISAWTLPMAFNQDYAELRRAQFNRSRDLGERITLETGIEGKVEGEKSDYAYLMRWDSYFAPKALYTLQKRGLRVKVAAEAFTDTQGRSFAPGTVLIPVFGQTMSKDEIHGLVHELAKRDAVHFVASTTGWSEQGIFLGSNNFNDLPRPRIALLVDGGVNSNDAGEVWHLLDQRFDIDMTLLPLDNIVRADLNRYNVILMVAGSYGSINNTAKDQLKSWVQNGGVIVAQQSASKWLADNGFTNVKFKAEKADTLGPKNYLDFSSNRGAQVIGGAIFKANIDTGHPIGYGYHNSDIFLFRNNTLFMEKSKNPYANPLRYTASPLAAGYISDQNLNTLKNTAAAQTSALGRGMVISFTDNHNFRAFWYGTNRLFLNSIFFGHTINSGTAR